MTTREQLVVPTVHLNGTSRERLLMDLDGAVQQLRVAVEALADTAPNGRDYYPQGRDAYGTALAQHEARVERLSDVREELEALYEAVDK